MKDWFQGMTAFEMRRPIDEERLRTVLVMIEQELRRAVALNSAFASMHEGFAVIHEEFDELKTEVWKNPKKHADRQELAVQEARQVGAMAARFLYDLGGKHIVS